MVRAGTIEVRQETEGETLDVTFCALPFEDSP
jgi:hypothetical protein